jgi:outer membrane receptor protein involved in Fe transport
LRVSQPLAGSAGLDLILQGSAGERGLPGPASAPTSSAREVDQGGLAGAKLGGALGEAAWSARAWGRADRVELRGVQAFGDCQDGTPGCPRSDQRYSTARGEGELGAPLGSAQWVRAQLSAGGEWIAGTGTGSHRRALASAALSDDLQLPAGLALHPAARLDAVGSFLGVSPALTAAWSPARSPLTLRAGWGLSFRPPTFNELFLESGGIAPNPDLQPERAWSLDAGAAWRTSRAQLAASVFYSRYAQLILYELNPSANQVKPFNIGAARISGLELQAVLRLPLELTAEAAWSYLHAVNGQAQDLPYRPPHRLFTRLARRGDRLEGYAESIFTSAMPRNSFGVQLGAQLVFNAGLGVRAVGPLWIDVEARNLLDDQTLEDLFQYPLPGRAIVASARARL